MEKIRVMRLIARLNVGGPAIQAIRLTKDLDPTRFESILVTGQCPSGEAEMSSVLEETGVTPIRIEGFGRAIHPLDDLRAFLAIQKLIQQFRPHILHTHTAKAGTLGRLAARFRGVPQRIHTFHGHVFSGYFSPLVSQAVIQAERALAKLSTRIIAISAAQKHDLVSVYRIAREDKVRIVPLGFPLERFAAAVDTRPSGKIRQQLGLQAHTKLVGIVGRVAPIKNHALFLDAMAQVIRHQPNSHAVIIGGGEETLMQALHTQTQRLGIAQHIHFLGYQSDLAPLYADLDLVVQSSKNEGTPVALIEALAAGVPCVATNVGGVSDVLVGGAYGKLVPSEQPAALAEAILTSLQEPIEHRRLSESALRRYGFQRLLQDIETLYLEK